jgi:pimeloyl-ACP methyl ester carboxylesterase
LFPKSGAFFFLKGGAGAPLVFLHGAFVTHCDWPPALLTSFARSFAVHAVDRPGHGKSRRPRFEAAPGRQALQIRNALRLDRPAILVAHSHGGLVALSYAEQFPDEVEAIVLLAPICLPEIRLIEQTFLGARATPLYGPVLSALYTNTIDEPFLRFIHRQMFAPQPPPAGWLERYPWGHVLTPEAFVIEGEEALALSPMNAGAYRDVSRLNLPIRMVLGGADRIVHHGLQALALAAMLPAAAINWVQGAGHMVHHVAPDYVAKAIKDVLR